MNKIIITLTLIAAPTLLRAQTGDIVKSYTDSLTAIHKTLEQTTFDEQERINPYYFQMFFPTTYYSSAARGIFNLDAGSELTPVNFQLIHMYATTPSVVAHYDGQFEAAATVQTQVENAPADDIRSVISQTKAENVPANKIADDLDIGLQVRRPNFWKTTGNFSLKFTQNYFSENWYQGGDNNNTMLAVMSLNATYNDTKRITWENKLDMRLGFITTKSDTCHSFLTNNDRIQLNTKLGIKAAKSWKYTISGEAKTQFMPGHRANNRLTYSKFISPLDVYVSIGMDFNPALKKGNTLSVAILPLSYKLRYIGSHNENIHKVYNFVNRTTTQDYGSKIEVNCKLNIVKNLTWKCRSYCFTSYEYVEAELENILSFSFSKYISSDIYTLWRFDDNRPVKYYDDNLGYFQFKEYFTLGLKYDF